MKTNNKKDLALVVNQVTRSLCSTSNRALQEGYERTKQQNELSLYEGSLSEMCIAKNMRKLQLAFPKQSKEFFNILAERLVANGFTDERLTDAVNNVIDNFEYKELNISNIIKFDKKVKLYNHKQASVLVTRNGYEFGKDLKRIVVDEQTYWTLGREV